VTEAVLDASAILASINREVGGGDVDDILDQAWASAVNLAEVVGKLIDNGSTMDQALEIAQGLPCRIVDFDREAAIQTGLMRRSTAKYGLSLGDRACLALAKREGCAALTTDRAWARVEVGVEIRMLR
jgi:PIN domain nuclease of toxin-antitoxin system